MDGSDVAPLQQENEGIGPLVRRRRLAMGLSQETLATRVGMSRAYLSQIEASDRKWPAQYVAALSRELGIPVSVLGRAAGRFIRDDEGVVPPQPERQSATGADDPILDLVMSGARELTPAGRKILLAQIEEIREMQRRLQEDLRREAERDLRRHRDERELEGGDIPPD